MREEHANRINSKGKRLVAGTCLPMVNSPNISRKLLEMGKTHVSKLPYSSSKRIEVLISNSQSHWLMAVLHEQRNLLRLQKKQAGTKMQTLAMGK